ncbi:LysM repeat protein [Paenibacillus sp. RC254]|uniref:LysM peptidoglycan-binding domain-containing protein n=1 Tax=unclassified Paenibacillus TaxID=185978 RepID=UPI0024BAF986|nr:MULTISPECIES: LysM peptidoglycan-binding domain-containing protein [unclassified Paenibacillus]
MKNVMKKVAVSSMLAISLGAVSLLSPLATGQVSAKSNSDYNKDQAELQLIIEQQEAAQKALEARLFGTENATTTTPAQPAAENNNQTTTPATTTVTPATVNTITVSVQDGDTLTSIAEKYGVTVEELLKINDLIKAGQELQVPQTNTNK